MYLFSDLAKELANFSTADAAIWRRLLTIVSLLVRFDVMTEQQGRDYIQMSFDAVDVSVVEHLVNHYTEIEDDVRAFLAADG